jgi:hypothetical protein
LPQAADATVRSYDETQMHSIHASSQPGSPITGLPRSTQKLQSFASQGVPWAIWYSPMPMYSTGPKAATTSETRDPMPMEPANLAAIVGEDADLMHGACPIPLEQPYGSVLEDAAAMALLDGVRRSSVQDSRDLLAEGNASGTDFWNQVCVKAYHFIARHHSTTSPLNRVDTDEALCPAV